MKNECLNSVEFALMFLNL